jgi:hypothetical protein
VVLAWQPDLPPSSPAPEEPVTPVTPITLPDRKKKQIKKGVIKKEPIEKRPISAGSAEPNIPAKRLPTGPPNVRTRAAIVKQEEPIEQDPTEDEDLPDLEEILRSAGKKM